MRSMSVTDSFPPQCDVMSFLEDFAGEPTLARLRAAHAFDVAASFCDDCQRHDGTHGENCPNDPMLAEKQDAAHTARWRRFLGHGETVESGF